MEIHVLRKDETKINKILRLLCKEFPQMQSEIHLVGMSRHGMTLEINPLKTRRSRPQENYYRKWCNGFAKFCGLTPDEMHNELLCQCYGSEEINTKFGAVRRPVKRSNDTSRGDYSELIETLCRVAAEMGYDVPPPTTEESP